MAKVHINKVQLLFECDEHHTKQQVSPIDLVLCGIPLCITCNEEMSIEDEAQFVKKTDSAK